MKKNKRFGLIKKRRAIYKRVTRKLHKRHQAEKRFRLYGVISLVISFAFLFLLIGNIIFNGYRSFLKTDILLSLEFSNVLNEKSDYRAIVRNGLREQFPSVTGRAERRLLGRLISSQAHHELRKLAEQNPKWAGSRQSLWISANSMVDLYLKYGDSEGNLGAQQVEWLNFLQDKGHIRQRFNTVFFSESNSRYPEQAGILGSVVASIFTIIVCMVVVLPLAVAAAVYLEEYAPKNMFTALIEVNINNLSAVPSIIFGLLGMVIYLQFLGVPRSSSLVGGLTLAMMALPIIVIATRSALRTVPQSIRDAAIAMGASKTQTTYHHVVPLAMPGIMTGIILGVARILGETAPLLMIGMVAFIVDVPKTLFDAGTPLPVQIYLWANNAERGFVEKTSAAILVLLFVLLCANAAAIYIRKKYTVRW